MAVTRAEVAKRAGVSGAVVTAVLNRRSGNTRVSEATRKRVLAVVRETGYRPQHAARALRRGSTGLVAALGLKMRGSPIIGPNESAMISAAERLNEQGYRLTVDYAEQPEQSFRLPVWDVDGALVSYADGGVSLRDVEQSDLPYVSVNGASGERGASVLIDDEQGTRLAMQHLLELGHRRIVYLGRPEHQPEHPSGMVRTQTYRSMMEAVGLKPIVERWTAVPHQQEPAPEPVRELMQRFQPTAVLAFHHFLGVELLHGALAAGIAVPRNLSIVCFNDQYPTAAVFPSLTAVALPVNEMGRHAADLLLQRIAGAVARRQIVLPVSLIVRQSTSHPRN